MVDGEEGNEMKKALNRMRQEGSAVPGPDFVRVCETAALSSLVERGLLSPSQMERCVERLEKKLPKDAGTRRHDCFASGGGCL